MDISNAINTNELRVKQNYQFKKKSENFADWVDKFLEGVDQTKYNATIIT